MPTGMYLGIALTVGQVQLYIYTSNHPEAAVSSSRPQVTEPEGQVDNWPPKKTKQTQICTARTQALPAIEGEGGDVPACRVLVLALPKQ